jgi:glycosyltransferase involved in cell wall biosynthesis
LLLSGLYAWSVEVVIGQLHLGAVGGAETYVLTVAEQLQRLGHGVIVFTLELGQSAALGLERGLEIRGSEDELPEACDIVLANDSVTAYRLAERYPTAPLVFVVHGEEYDLCVPPQVPDVVQAAVVLHDRVGRWVRALGHVPEVVRLRQPVDTKRFLPRTSLRDPARRVLMLGNWVHGDRRDVVLEVCASLGLECDHRGFRGGASTLEPELELCRADIVIGKARVIVEAMASGRAAYVYDHNGGDGWVTPDRYALLEADNFGGQAEPTVIDAERLRRDLAGYSRLMGLANRDLAVVNHSANRHAQSLVELFQRLVPSDRRVVAPFREMARLVRVGWLSEWRAVHWAGEAQRLRAELDDTATERDRLARENDALRAPAASGAPDAVHRLGLLTRLVRVGPLSEWRRAEPGDAGAERAGEV